MEGRGMHREVIYMWIYIISKFTPRTGHSVVVLDDHLFLFCGSDNENILNDMYMYNITTMKWTLL